MQDIIQFYENGQNFHEGVKIAQKYGVLTPEIAAIARQGGYISDYQRDMLRVLIDSIDTNAVQETGISDVYEQISANPTHAKERVSAFVPPEILALKEEAKRWHKKEAAAHEALHLATDKETRAAIAHEKIVVIGRTLDAIYDKIRVYEETGMLPEVAEKVQTETEKINALWQEKLNIEPQLSRHKGKNPDLIIQKFERLKEIHEILGLTFVKKIEDYL